MFSGFTVFVVSSLTFLTWVVGGDKNVTESTVPSKPLNLTVVKITDTSVELSWLEPEIAVKDICGYYIYYIYMVNNSNSSIKLSHISPVMNYTVTNLEPFAKYKMWVKAFTNKHEGAPSDHVQLVTDVAGPGPPLIVNASCVDYSTLVVRWQRPTLFNNTIDYYYILYRLQDAYDFEEISIPSSERYLDVTFKIEKLTGNGTYEIKIKGASRSIENPNVFVKGKESESRTVLMGDCTVPSSFKESDTTLFAGIVSGSFALLLFLVALVFCRKCFDPAYYYLEDPIPLPPTSITDWDTQAEPESTVPLHQFTNHVATLHADGDIGFSKEYEAIQVASAQQQLHTEYSQHPENKNKNRYLNILAYDHSRVRLLPITGQNRWIDYINANYIDGFQRKNAYIGTQGPLPITFDAFWRMIWEQGVAIIVMITNLVERGRRKCDMYWPKEGTELYGFIQVKLIKEDVLAMYTVRTLQILHLHAKKKKHNLAERTIYQYHYTNWPDHGTPDHPLPILSFVKKSSAANPPDAGPIVVHCSAGVGRTGTYIVLDAMLKQILHKNEVNVYGFLRHIRTQRNFLVQTEEQYIFIHDALLEAIICSETSLSNECIAYLIKTSSDPTTDRLHEHWKRLEAHFQMVTAFQPKDYNLVSANKSCNQPKNRSQQFVPVESSRVHLTPKPGVDGSDYINASWYLGFKKLREFIITQHPLESTLLDFWQMIWDHNAQTIVLLSTIDQENPEYGIFWPTEGEETLDGENFKVKCIEESELDGTVCRDLTVQSLQDDYELTVRIIQSPCSEPLSDLPGLLRLLTVVQQWHLEYQNGPIVVVDRFGGTEAVTFCCLATITKQLEYENHADVCMYAKLYHNRRPGVWQTMDNYLLLYQALEILSASKGVTLVPSPSPTRLQPNGYTNGSLGSSLPTA